MLVIPDWDKPQNFMLLGTYKEVNYGMLAVETCRVFGRFELTKSGPAGLYLNNAVESALTDVRSRIAPAIRSRHNILTTVGLSRNSNLYVGKEEIIDGIQNRGALGPCQSPAYYAAFKTFIENYMNLHQDANAIPAD